MGKIKKLTGDEIDKITNDLLKGTSKQKKSSVKKIGKFLINQLSKELLDSYISLKKTPRNWEMQAEMIKSLGLLKVVELLPFVEVIVEQNLNEDMITIEASKAFIRVESSNNEEMKYNIFQLLNKGGKSVKDGAVAILASENLVLSKEEIHLLIDLIDGDSAFDEDLDYREYLISAMALWPKDISTPFFEKYTNDKRINQEVLKEAKKGRGSYSDY